MVMIADAYERARDKAADKHFAPEFVCAWCDCASADEETCTECGESMICPKCGHDDELHLAHADACPSHDEVVYRACSHCNHQWDWN